jgi:hypothetical protein
VLDLQIVEKWDGVVPLVVGPRANAANMILPLESTDSKMEVSQ